MRPTSCTAMTVTKYIHAEESNLPWNKYELDSSLLYVRCDRTHVWPTQLYWQVATDEGKPSTDLAGQPICQQITKETLWSELEVSNLTWPSELNFFLEDSGRMQTKHFLPKMCSERRDPGLFLFAQCTHCWALAAVAACSHPLQHSMMAGEEKTCTLHHCIVILWPQLKLGCACARGVQKCSAGVPSCEEPYSAVEGVEHAPFLIMLMTFFYRLFLNTLYLFLWQKQGCPASVYSKDFICQTLAALVTISSIISFVQCICLHCSLNLPSSALF